MPLSASAVLTPPVESAPSSAVTERTISGIAIFLGAFLLFQVEPIIAKMILPWFGGSAVVWEAGMLVFQFLLLPGDAYSALLFVRTRRVRRVVAAGVLW